MLNLIYTHDVIADLCPRHPGSRALKHLAEPVQAGEAGHAVNRVEDVAVGLVGEVLAVFDELFHGFHVLSP